MQQRLSFLSLRSQVHIHLADTASLEIRFAIIGYWVTFRWFQLPKKTHRHPDGQIEGKGSLQKI
jgi:hypothetical protein